MNRSYLDIWVANMRAMEAALARKRERDARRSLGPGRKATFSRARA